MDNTKLLINSAPFDVALSRSTLVALHRYLPLSATVALFSVKLLLTPFLCFVSCVTPEVYDLLFLCHVIVSESLPLAKHSNDTLSLLLTNCFCGCLQNDGIPAVRSIAVIMLAYSYFRAHVPAMILQHKIFARQKFCSCH